MQTPKHFISSRAFTRFIYEIAIRDLNALVHAHTPRFGFPPDAAAQKIIDETKAEIAAIQARIKRLR